MQILFLHRIFRCTFALLLSVVATLYMLPEDAHASTIVQRSVEDMSARSDTVVRGTIIARESLRYKGQIVTRLHLAVEEHIAGESVPERLNIWLPGGDLDGLRAHVSGVAYYSEGDEIIAFLEHGPEGSWRALALSWSTYHCEGDMAYRSIRSVSGIVPHRNPLLSKAQVLQNTEDHALPISTLRARIQHAGATP